MSIASPHSQRLPPPPAPPLLKRPVVWVALLGVALIGVVVWRATQQKPVERIQLPVLATVPAFSFVDESGKTFGSEQLKGKIWAANFIFTRCPNICPKFTAKMAALQNRSASAAPQLSLVSFTIDPEHDTPEVLAVYGQKFNADSARWHFLRGERAELEKVVRDGMMQPMDMGDGEDLNTVVHGSYFALIDGSMQVRGVYRFSEPGAVDEVVRDANVLVR